MRDGACGSACHGIRQANCTPFWNDYSMRACGESRANDGAEIVWIFHAIEKNDEPFASMTRAFICRGENAIERGRRTRGSESDHTLMIFCIGHTIELATVFEADRDVTRAG